MQELDLNKKALALKASGEIGEIEVTDLVECPNCAKQLMQLPEGYPLYDVQCVACSFRVQVKSSSSKPHNVIRGAGWDIMESVLRSGYLIPPLMVNFKWMAQGVEKQEIRFYPFIKTTNLKKRLANIKSKNRMHWMFDYNLKNLPYFIVYQK